MIEDLQVSMPDLPNRLNSLFTDGYGTVCMYAVEGGDAPRAIHSVLRKNNEITHITTTLDSNEYPSVSSWMPGLEPYEQEMREMNGLMPIGLSEDGPQRIMWRYADSNPLQKNILSNDRVNVPLPGNGIDGEGVFEISVGPVHAGVIGSGHFRFSVAGEQILKMKNHLGYTHRGVERMLETPSSKNNMHLVERISGDSAVAYALAYAHTIERDSEIPYRAKLLRVVFAELERISSHLNTIGGIALDTGFSIPAVTCAGLREKMLRLNESITGSRFLMGTVTVGGVAKDITKEDVEIVRNRILKIEFDVEDLMHMLSNSASFTDRVETTGILTLENARMLRTVGPVSRASGTTSDVRKDRPYDAYPDLSMNVITSENGDVQSRLDMRADEIIESANLISQCLENLENGPVCSDVSPQDGFSLGLVESPRGELMHAANVVNGNIWRYKIRDPSFINWVAMEYAVLNNIIPDFPLINKSFGLSYSGNDL